MAFVCAIVILAGAGAVSYRGIGLFRESTRWVIHTTEVVGRLQDLRYAMKSVESGCRGYALTGKE